MNIRKYISKRDCVACKLVLICIQEKKSICYMKGLGISLVVEIIKDGTYLLDIPSAKGTEPGRFLFFDLLGRSVTTLNPNQTTWRETCITRQTGCLIPTKSTRGEYFEILFHSHNSHSLYLYIPIGFWSHEANMEFNELYTWWDVRAAFQGVSF